jgi:uncharacterized protein (TIGR00730 family)
MPEPAPDPPSEPPPGPRRPLEAYEDVAFLRSPDARTIRVVAELLEPQFRLRREGIEDTIVFFGSARIPDPSGPRGVDPHPGLARLAHYYDEARRLAEQLTRWSDERPGSRRFVVCSGGGPGVMEAANRGAADAGGASIGLGITIPEEQSTNAYVTPDLAFLFHYFFLRKFWFVYNAKALVFFPGGYGTMDELMEVLTLVQTRKVRKPMGIVLYGSDYWRSVLNFDAMVDAGVISPADRDLFVYADDVPQAFDVIRAFLEENYGPTLLVED